MDVAAISWVSMFAHAYKTQAKRRVVLEYVSFACAVSTCAILGAPETRATATFRCSKWLWLQSRGCRFSYTLIKHEQNDVLYLNM